MKEIYFKDEVKEKLFSGIEKLYEAVSSTMGPNGKTVTIVDAYNKPLVTKDGVSVAKAIHFKDPIENAGAELVKQAAEKTLTDAGDGTTTSTVLAYSLIKNLRDYNYNDVVKALDEIIPKVIEELKKNSRVLNHEDIKHVANISANNDLQIAELIQQAYDFSNIIKVEEGNDNVDILEKVNGMKHDVSYFSKHFINNVSKGECTFETPHVLILNTKIERLDNLNEIFNYCFKINKPLIVITEHIDSVALTKVESLVLNKEFKIAIVKSPGISSYRKDLLEDLCKFTGATLINSLSNPIKDINVLGALESIKISKNNTLFVKDKTIDISSFIEELTTYRDSLESFDKDLITKRIEHLKANVCVIKVGGITEVERKERFDRYEDAVKGVAAALEEGIVEGGGVSLIKSKIDIINIDTKDIDRIILNCLESPYKKIVKNGTRFHPEHVEDNIFLPDNMFIKNIIDPLKVTRCALENAVSVTKTILSTETVVLNEYLWK